MIFGVHWGCWILGIIVAELVAVVLLIRFLKVLK